jgi:hypothetical protein
MSNPKNTGLRYTLNNAFQNANEALINIKDALDAYDQDREFQNLIIKARDAEISRLKNRIQWLEVELKKHTPNHELPMVGPLYRCGG